MSAANTLIERQAELERLVFDDRVTARRVNPYRVELGVQGEEPLVTIVPCTNHRVKNPIGFVCLESGEYQLLTYAFREDLQQLKGSRGGDDELDIFKAVNEILAFDLGFKAIACGYRGSMIMQTGFNEFTLQIEAMPIARMHTDRFPPPGSVKTTCRGLTFYVTIPSAIHPAEFQDFAMSITPSFVGVSWSKERKRREELRKAS